MVDNTVKNPADESIDLAGSCEICSVTVTAGIGTDAPPAE